MPTSSTSSSTSLAAQASARPATSASEAASSLQRRFGEPAYSSMPTPSFVRPAQAVPSQAAAPAPIATEIVSRPAPHSLAAGRFEAKAFQIWLLPVAGAILVLAFALARLRRATKKQRRAAEALTSVLRRPTSHPTR